MPHLSLVYGDLDIETKTQVMADLSTSVIGKSFDFGTLQLWKTEGFHGDWKCIKSLQLPLPLSEMSNEYSKEAESRNDIYQWAAARKALIRAHNFTSKKGSDIGADIEESQDSEEDVRFIFIFTSYCRLNFVSWGVCALT